MIKWALIGAGSWMENYHLPILKKLRDYKLIEIVGIWNRTSESAHRIAKQFMIPRVYSSIDELLEDSIDCVSIVLNKEIVAEYIQLIANRGIPFLTEKPPADSYREALKILKVTKGVSHIVGFNRRYLNVIQQTRQLLPTKTTGYEFNMWRANRNDNRYIFETGIHALNLVEYMFGPVIQAQILSDQAVADDITAINLKLMHEKCEGIINFQTHANDAREQFRIYGKECIIELFLNQPLAGDHQGSLMIFENGKWDFLKYSTDFVDDYFGFYNEYLEMLAILSGSKVSSSTLESSLSCLRIAEWTEHAKIGDSLNI
jgi:predicted dehydrogenase